MNSLDAIKNTHSAHLFLDHNAHYAYKKLMTARELIKKLEEAGFVNKGGTNHDKMVHPDGRVTVIHRHKGDIPLGTLKAIARQTKIKVTLTGRGEQSPLQE